MLGTGPSELHPTDPDARIMDEGGYWITDFSRPVHGRATFRAGGWKELTTRVHRLGEVGWIELEPDAGPGDVAKEVFAQPKGNLRAWRSDQAENVAEIYYSD